MKKKYPRLPNGFESIRNLGKGRRHPYAVHPPATEQDEKGNYIHLDDLRTEIEKIKL